MGAGQIVGAATPDDLAFFEKKIRPLLIERCYECHSEGQKIKAGLRLDTPHGWREGGDSGPAVVPGKADQSILIRAVRANDIEFEAMPPKTALSPEEVALLTEWVQRGAPAPDAAPVAAHARPKQVGLTIEEGRTFWAFVPPRPPTVPAAGKNAWPRTEIDRFIAAKWDAKSLRPTADADRPTLLRRATFDLIGLPPTPEQIEAFVRDTRPDAFARVIDELLASPHYGERWGRHWLDVARFAESSGGGRTLLFKDAWRFRDYVIEAFNRDVPFDTFIREQIAGDLLPASSPEQRRRQLNATAFLALGPTNYEEQNKGALRMDIVDEQIDTIGKGFLGMTIGCARCHDHKFDPVPTKDYYALAGILRSTRTLANYTDNVARWVETSLPVDDEAGRLVEAHDAKVKALEKTIAALKASTKSNAKGAPAQAAAEGVAEPLAGIVLDESQAKVVGEWRRSSYGKTYFGDGYVEDRNEGKGAKTVTFTPAIPRSGRYEVRLAYTANANRASNVPVTILHADGERTLTIDQREEPPIGGRMRSLGQYQFEKDGAGYVLISNEGTAGHVVVDTLQLIPVEELVASVAAAGKSAPGAMAKAPPAAAELKRLEAELKKLVAAAPARPQTMSVAEDAAEIGDTEIRVRGNVRTLGAKVPRGFLQVAMTGPAPQFSTQESGRRELADWIASPSNPLTARVIVNRVWSWLIGPGLVRTVDNFGTTGETPSHPELLDHLALRFVADGWSIKRLVREIMLSRTYQLATATDADVRTIDPDNRLFARAERRRLDAEQIRDAVLWTSGKLNLELGGPNITGPNGASASTLPVSAEYTYVFTDTRRSVYTPAFRNKRLDLFEVFDFADANAPFGKRNVSTVAPQALFLMNHPFVIEQAALAAERTLSRAGLDDAARIDHAYRVTLGRPPAARERDLALQFLASAAGSDPGTATRHEAWAQLYQSIFACIDFRYLN